MCNVQFLQKEAVGICRCSKLNRVNVVLGTYIHIELNFLAVEIKKNVQIF